MTAFEFIRKQKDVGRKVIVTDPIFKTFYGKEMFCIGYSIHGFIQLAFKENQAIADLYLGVSQYEFK